MVRPWVREGLRGWMSASGLSNYLVLLLVLLLQLLLLDVLHPGRGGSILGRRQLKDRVKDRAAQMLSLI